MHSKQLFLILLFGLICCKLNAQVRQDVNLNEGWRTIAHEHNDNAYAGFERKGYSVKNWQSVTVPHTWDRYEGYQRKLHGNKHGYAWYRKTFAITKQPGKHYFLFFEGVGSYATVWLNGVKVGYHAGGRTTFTIDVTKAIQSGNANILAVRADHPAAIRDLPWVDGGCSSERGFSEGSQPMGIFRPVHLIVTNAVKVEPFGVHIWNEEASAQAAKLNLNTTVKNYDNQAASVTVQQDLIDRNGKIVVSTSSKTALKSNEKIEVKQKLDAVKNPILWSLENPYCYTVRTTISKTGKVIDRTETPYGIRRISWPIGQKRASKQFLLNGKPVFIKGIAEYEHLIGNSHAFTEEQIRSRVSQIKQSGFNAFRDAHQPHNLRYQNYLDEMGILSWTQLSGHIWFDNEAFKKNFKSLLQEWVIERRNSPSVVLWGLQNESTLPEAFAKECTDLIRSLDPTASSQRKVTTCNGGKGTDWDVPQNWTGTYGGNPATYGEDLKRQVLVGEYGGWRTLDLHTGEPDSKVEYTENYMSTLMETKVRLADSVKQEVAGHFFWLYSSHDNPGRVQGGEGLRDLDRIGPVNYKGMFTPWEEPTDVYYMFKANYTSAKEAPMAYIVSPNWPNRFAETGAKTDVIVYSNCDEVELFNDVGNLSFGKIKKGKIGTHFSWPNISIAKNLLYAVGYVDGKAVAKHVIRLQNLPKSPSQQILYTDHELLKPSKNRHYVYRYNCGGPDYTDSYGNHWSSDRNLTDKNHFGSLSWTAKFDIKPAAFASQRRTFAPITNTKDEALFQTFRYGREELKFYFPLPNGSYEVELYFVEPWLGVGGGMDAKGMRLFDVAFNGNTVLKDLDIWSAVGTNKGFKKTIPVKVVNGSLTISFPNTKVAQALISAIAISAAKNVRPVPESKSLFKQVSGAKLETWMDIGMQQFASTGVQLLHLPPQLFGAEWLQTTAATKVSFALTDTAAILVCIDSASSNQLPQGFEDTKSVLINSAKQRFKVYRKRFNPEEKFSFQASVPFTVAATVPSNLQPAFDLKTVTSYKASEAKLKGNDVALGQLMDKTRAIFSTEPGSSMTFAIQTGVADVYSFTLKYHNPANHQQQVKLQLFDVGGTLLKSEYLTLDPTKAGKWNYLTTNSGSMINAGSYTIVITSINASGLAIDAVEIQ